MECPFCYANEQYKPVCMVCGSSLCKEDIVKLNKESKRLNEKYKECYTILFTYLKENDTIPAFLKEKLLELPKPDRVIKPVDIICIGCSILFSYLEHFYPIKTTSGLSLGEYVKREILNGYDYNRLYVLSNYYKVLC